jgi:hypothetical protein
VNSVRSCVLPFRSSQAALPWSVIACTVFCSGCYRSSTSPPIQPSSTKPHRSVSPNQSVSSVQNAGWTKTVVPFQLIENMVYLPAVIDGRYSLCVLDTGTDLIQWPHSKGMAKSVHRLDVVTRYTDRDVLTRPMKLGTVDVGGFEVRNVRAEALEARYTRGRKGDLVPMGHDDLGDRLSLGNDLFGRTVTTIDYRAGELVIRSPEEWKREGPPRPARVLPLSWAWQGKRSRMYPVVDGKLAGRPAQFAIDTGTAGMVISRAVHRRHYASNQTHGVKATTLRGTVHLRSVEGVKGSIGDIEIEGNAAVFDQDFGTEAILGGEFLKNFRVTIDYPNSRLYLEQYDKPRK